MFRIRNANGFPEQCTLEHSLTHTVASDESTDLDDDDDDESDVDCNTEELSMIVQSEEEYDDQLDAREESDNGHNVDVASTVITLQMDNGRKTTTTTTTIERSLETEDENYVCDISLMSIGDDDGGEDTATQEPMALVCDSAGGDRMAPIGSHVHDCRSRGGMREVRIARRDEKQTITELVRASGEEEGSLMSAGQSQRMHVAFGIILRLVLPLAHGVVRGIRGIRDARFLRSLSDLAFSRQSLTSLIAFAANSISMNLSAVQVTHRIEPILKILKIRKSYDGLESLPDSTPTTPMSDTTTMPTLMSLTANTSPSTPTMTLLYSPIIREPKGARHEAVAEEVPPKCCTLQVLAEPAPGMPIRADIVFIHGLHGSLANTWKQGLWTNERQPVGFERPPKPPVRPPKRPRHSRGHLIHPQHRHKRARFAHHINAQQRRSCERSSTEELHEECFGPTQAEGCNEFSFVCGEPRNIQICDGVEYSFPTFRLRMNDTSKQLQADLASILKEGNDVQNGDHTNKQHTKGRTKNTNTHLPTADIPTTANDSNYSKCWPGDWLPLDCPGVRVLACNYTTDQYLWRPLWKKKEPRTNLVKRAREMAELLVQARVGYGHPIIWVGHSKGGLFVKQLIVDAWETGRPATEPFWRSARGCFFYSVPHRGSHLASIKAPLLTRSVELIDIEKNSKYLLDLHRRFASLYHLGHLKIEVFSFVETALTLMSVLYLRIVGADSADPGIGEVCGIRLDHREICKPRSRECILYKQLVKMINKVC